MKHSESKKSKQTVLIFAIVFSVLVVMALVVVIPLVIGEKDIESGTSDNSDKVEMMIPKPTVEPISIEEVKNYATSIVINMNPSVEIRLDEQDVVIEVVGLNDDGVALIEGIDFTAYSLENATIMIVNQLILHNYITAAEVQEEINISLVSDDMTLDTLDVMTNIIKTAAAEQNIAVDVLANEGEKQLQIVLEGQGNHEIWPDLDTEPNEEDTAPEESRSEDNTTENTEPTDADNEEREITLDVVFDMASGTYSAYVDNVLIHVQGRDSIENMLDFGGMSLGRAALYSIVELMEKGYITDHDPGIAMRVSFTGDCRDSDIHDVAHLTSLLIAEYDLHISLTTDVDTNEIYLIANETKSHETQTSKHAIKDVLNYMVNKDEADLSSRQIEILKSAYNYREYQRLFEKRYFVIIPDIIGMHEDEAVNCIKQLGIVPAVVREKIAGYDPTNDENESGETQESKWEFPVVDFGCVFAQDIAPGSTYQVGLPFQMNVVVTEDDDRPEVLDFREDSGIVTRDMDVPFDVSKYPDDFILSEVEGFNPIIKEMNVTYEILDKANYAVNINRDLGWEDMAMITLTHKDGFPQSKFFIQQGRIIEHEFLWRRGVPTTEDAKR